VAAWSSGLQGSSICGQHRVHWLSSGGHRLTCCCMSKECVTRALLDAPVDASVDVSLD